MEIETLQLIITPPLLTQRAENGFKLYLNTHSHHPPSALNHPTLIQSLQKWHKKPDLLVECVYKEVTLDTAKNMAD